MTNNGFIRMTNQTITTAIPNNAIIHPPSQPQRGGAAILPHAPKGAIPSARRLAEQQHDNIAANPTRKHPKHPD
jgi:hypothetical protein